MICAIENLKEKTTKQEKLFSKSKHTLKYILSPSEQQLVLHELAELPPEVSLALQGRANSGDIIVVTKPDDFERSKPEPVKLLHHKGLNSRRKGLSLATQPPKKLPGKN